ncbi:unnamed protein product [Heterobilharzia americana]|nr:unnamed protein product [Heterobilharzia americana]
MIKRIYQNAEVDEDNIAGYDGYSEANKSDIPYLLVLPYFFEKKLQKIAPSVNLLDYKITYENHSRMDYDKNDMEVDEMTTSNSNKSNTGQRRDSIVRLFTSLPPSSVHPPKSLEASFRFCEICQRYSHITNLHCAKCNRCTTKNGPTYVHCDKCGRCRPTKKFHCDSFEKFDRHFQNSYYQLPSYVNKQCTYSTCFNINNCVHELVDKPLHTIRVYMYPLLQQLNDTSHSPSFSQQFISLHNTILSSKYYVNRIEDACILVPGIDLLYIHQDKDQVTDLSLRYLNHLPRWNDGKNHLLINFYQLRSWTIQLQLLPKFDIVLPAFNPYTVILDSSINKRRSIFLIVFPSTSQEFVNHVKYLLLDSRKSNADSSNTIIILDYSNQSDVTYEKRFVLASESEYRQGVKKWINYSESLCSSEYCLVVDADNANRFNLYDSLACGCIPVIANDDIVLPFSEVLDWNKIVIRIPRVKFQKIPSILSTYSSREKFLLRQQILFIYERYFSSVEKILLTTLDILNDRVFPQYSRSYAEWNYPNYSRSEFPISPVLFYPAKAFPQAGLLLSFELIIILPYLQIVVVWTNKMYPIPESILWPSLKVPLSVVRSAYGSVNGRYFPYRQIRTEAVFSIEEDTCLPSAESIERAFELWCQNPERLFSCCFFNKHYLHLYTNLLADHIKAFIDELDTCEDIFFYWLIIQTSYGQSVLSSSSFYNHQYSFMDESLRECHTIPKHCSLHANRLKNFVKNFHQFNYPLRISHLIASAL